MAPANTDNAAHVIHPPVMMAATPNTDDDAGRQKISNHRHHLHCGCPMRVKAMAMSNAFRKVVGLPLIEEHPHVMAAVPIEADGLVHILPMPFNGTNERGCEMTRRPRWRHHALAHQDASFMRRIHRALMSLGPWEGRAVAFVLGESSIFTSDWAR